MPFPQNQPCLHLHCRLKIRFIFFDCNMASDAVGRDYKQSLTHLFSYSLYNLQSVQLQAVVQLEESYYMTLSAAVFLLYDYLHWKCSECRVLLEEELVDWFSLFTLTVLPAAGSPLCDGQLTLGIVCLTGAGFCPADSH